MLKGMEIFAGELHKPAEDIRSRMPGFFDKMKAPDHVDLTRPVDYKRADEIKAPIQNKQDGLQREKDVAGELLEKYPPEKGYSTIPEATLRDKDGNIVRDPKTGEARRIDFVVAKDGKAVDSIEVTSQTADKEAQSAKEARIREAGGNYIKDDNGNLIEIPKAVQTRIERRD